MNKEKGQRKHQRRNDIDEGCRRRDSHIGAGLRVGVLIQQSSVSSSDTQEELKVEPQRFMLEPIVEEVQASDQDV